VLWGIFQKKPHKKGLNKKKRREMVVVVTGSSGVNEVTKKRLFVIEGREKQGWGGVGRDRGGE